MPRQLHRLTARTVATATKPGRHADGGNLYLVVDKSGAKRWVFLFRWQGRLREMGLGGVSAVSLAKARELAGQAREQSAQGVNPLDSRRADERIPTFGEAADALIESLKPEWRNAKHVYQWEATLKKDAKSLRPIPVDQVTTEDVLKVLRPIWTTKPETASRLRGRIERVLDAAKALGHRTGENPALWRGHLKSLLPKRQKLTRGHHPAMPYTEVPALMEALVSRDAIAALALRFTILTAARTNETLGATWGEIDVKSKVWTVPAERTKPGKEHRVPLSKPALAIIEQLAQLRTSKNPGDFVFPGFKRGRPLSGMAMEMLLRRLKVANASVHGFRSSFRDWAGEQTSFPREVAEAALSHQVGDEVERAYRRGDALEKRRKLMEAWGSFCAAAPKKGSVT